MAQPIFQLQGQTALITGAGRGMGVGIAKTLGEQGATVLINDLFPDRAGVAYFASREASWVTGQVLPLNGGSLTA